MAPIKWNAPTIALTVNAILVGLAGLASLSGDDSALPPNFKTDNVHVVRAIGHELLIMMCLMICGVVNNMAQKMCPYFGAGVGATNATWLNSSVSMSAIIKAGA